MFEKNVGKTDSIIRFILGIVLIGLGIFLFFAGNTIFGIILGLVALIPLVTSLTGTCPLYSIFGISTSQVTKS